MEFSWSVEESALRDEVRKVLAAELPDEWYDLVPGEEPASDFVHGFCRTLGGLGLLTPHWPEEYGGRGASGWQFIILGEELWQAGEPRGSQYMNVNWIGPAIMIAGTDDQKREHLGRIAAGDVFWCQGFSELEAGSDLRAMQTTAIRDGDEYVINGVKVWTSYAAQAEYCFLLARTGGAGAREDVSIFLVPTSAPGLTIERIPSVLDIHHYHRLTFEDVRVRVTDRLGAEGEGWQVVRAALSHERIGGLGTVVAEGPHRDGLRTRLAQALADCHAARLLVYRAINERVNDRPEQTAVSLARVAIVRAERAVADLALELAEQAALPRGSTGNAQLKTSMIAGLGGGSVEVQLNLVADALLGTDRS
jgi:alkylation response protein AidB-like acyl-CoA dehydrogenase